MIQMIEIYCAANFWDLVVRGDSPASCLQLERKHLVTLTQMILETMSPKQRESANGQDLLQIIRDNTPNTDLGAPGSPFIPQYENAPPASHVYPLPGGVEGSREATMGQPAPESHAV